MFSHPFSSDANDCISRETLKFAEDTTMLGFITDAGDSAYRKEVEQIKSLFSHNCLLLNAKKTVEMMVDFGYNPLLSHTTISVVLCFHCGVTQVPRRHCVPEVEEEHHQESTTEDVLPVAVEEIQPASGPVDFSFTQQSSSSLLHP